MKNVLCIILGGGRGRRLYPLTKYRCKPAIPLAGKYRLIDIPISNCINSGFNKIYVLTQFNSESLNKHINRSYKMDVFSKGFVEIIAAEQTMDNTDWFQGTADAVRRCLKHFNDPAIEYIFVLGGDHLYSMDLSVVLKEHVQKKSDVTILCNPIKDDDFSEFGIMGIDEKGRINQFIEKPKDVSRISSFYVLIDKKKCFLASMGIYLFNKQILEKILLENKKTDFGREIIPDSLSKYMINSFIYKGYWRDIGTLKTFYDENISLTQPNPPLDIFNEQWPFFSRSRFLPPARIDKSILENTLIGDGAILSGVKIKNSIIGLRSVIKSGTEIENSIIMGCDFYENQMAEKLPTIGIGKNCVIKKAIIDKNVRIGDNVKIINKDGIKDYEEKSYCIKDGIVIIMKNAVIASNTQI